MRRAAVLLTIVLSLCSLAMAQTVAPTSNPIPFVNQPLVPDAVSAATATITGFTITVNGAGFVSGSTVEANVIGTTTVFSLATTFVSSHQLTATFPGGIAPVNIVPGSLAITVVNPTPGGGISNVAYFQMANPVSTPTFSSLTTTPFTVGVNPQTIAVGDFNGDGKLDLAVANSGSNSVTILLGNGKGSFTQAPGSPIPVGTLPTAIAVGDFNGDGKLDLAVANAGDNNVTILLGNGNGTFTQASGSPIAVGTDPVAIAAGDFNGDGKLDLAVVNAGSNNVTILLGNGDGTFAPAASSPATGSNPVSVAVGDFNGDGKLDLAVVNRGSNTVTVLLGNGDGTFTQASGSPIPVGAIPTAIAAADFNGDGKLDLAVANADSGNVTILLGNGDGTFTPAASSPAAGLGPDCIAVGDFNGDGKLDLAVGDSDNNGMTVLLGNGDGTFTPTPEVSISSPVTTPSSIVAGDFDDDGMLDLATGSATGTQILVFLQPPEPDVSLSTNSVAFADQVVNTTSSPESITVTNTGSSNLTFGSGAVTLTGANAAEFSLSSDTCSNSTVAPNGTCSATVTFTPTATGSASATLNFADNAPRSPQTVSLTGTGVSAGVVSLSTFSLNFGDEIVGTSTNIQYVTLTNVGTGPMVMSSITVTPTDFAMVAPNTAGPPACQTLLNSPLAAGASCRVALTFTPSTVGSIAGLLTITDDTATSPETVSLFGTGLTAAGSVGSVVVPGTAGPWNYVNGGLNTNFQYGVDDQSSPIVVSGASGLAFLSGNTITVNYVSGTVSANPSFFPFVDANGDLSVVINNSPGSSGKLDPSAYVPSSQYPVYLTELIGVFTDSNGQIVGQPFAVGDSGTFVIPPGASQLQLGANDDVYSDNAGSWTLQVFTSGVNPASNEFSATSLTFSSQPVGTVSAAQTLTLTNKGSVPLGNISFSVVGDFAQTNNCPVSPNTLAVGASCTISVTFNPVHLGSLTGTLIESDSSSTSSQGIFLSGTGAPVPFAKGELFFSLGNGTVLRESPTGQLIQIMDTGTGTYTYGMAFDSSDNLYVSDFGARNVSKFSNTGVPEGFFGSGYGGSVEDVAFNSSGDLIAGSVDGDNTIRIFSPTGAPIAAYPALPENRGIDWFDLAPDQCTLYYTSEGVEIKRFNICTGQQLSDFVSNLPGVAAYALRFLPSGGLLVADSSSIVRLDASGNIIQTYTAPNASELYGLNLDPDGTSFWTGDYQTEEVYRFDIATGALLNSFPVTTIPGGFGIAVNGQITAATAADVAVTETASPTTAILGANLTYTLSATNNGPNPAPNTVVTDTLPSGVTFVSSASSVGSCTGTSTVTCNLGTLANGASATITIVITPTAVGTLVNKVSISSGVSDPNPSNNTATLSTTVSTGTITLSPTSLNFPPQLAGTTSNPETVTVKNNSEGPVTISNISVSAGSFAESNTCGTSLAGGANCQVNVTFSPQCAGTCHCTLSIFDDAAGSPQTVPLSGIGQDFKLVATTIWQTVSPGGSGSYPFSIVPEGGLNTPVQFTCSGAPAGATCAVTPSSVTLDGTDTASATVQVTTAAPTLAPPRGPNSNPSLPLLHPALWLALCILAGCGVVLAQRLQLLDNLHPPRNLARVALALTLLGLMAWASCGGGPAPDPPGTPQGVYTLTVTGTTTSGSATSSHSFTVTLAVD